MTKSGKVSKDQLTLYQTLRENAANSARGSLSVTMGAEILYNSILNIYLDKRDNREGEQLGLKPNGFTEATVIKDYPIRNRKVLLHVRRRRYLDADGRNNILNRYLLTADGTKVSVEFGLFLKTTMDNLPLTATALGRFFILRAARLNVTTSII